jgi:hypothetical protein
MGILAIGAAVVPAAGARKARKAQKEISSEN